MVTFYVECASDSMVLMARHEGYDMECGGPMFLRSQAPHRLCMYVELLARSISCWSSDMEPARLT